PAGGTRCAPTCSTPTRWSRTCGPATRRATPPRSSTARSTSSSSPGSAGASSRPRSRSRSSAAGVENSPSAPTPGCSDQNGSHRPRRETMAKYLLLKHYRGAPTEPDFVPMEEWTPDEVSAHVQFMNDFAASLVETGEFVESQALSE